MEHTNPLKTKALFVSGAGWRWLLLAAMLALIPAAATAQDAETGAISGRIVDSWQGGPLAGVTVLVRGTTLGTTTDSAGTYTVSKIPPGTYAVVLTRSGYGKATISDVRVAAGQRTTADYALKPEFYEMETYEAVAEPVLDQGTVILVERQKADIVMDVLGSDMISKLGAGDAAEVVGRTTGATIVDGKFAVIRGLDERYTSTSLNGGEIPSADPYRKSGQLDLFPSELIESVSVTKTFTPDQPGSFTGGAVNIRTKSFPEKTILTWSVGVTYNDQASLNKDFASYPGGSTDYFGFDDGTRAIPDALNNTTVPNRNQGANAAERAANNAKLFAQTRAFGTTEMGPVKSTSGVETDFSASYGDRTKLFGKDLGFFAGMSYERKFDFYDDGRVSRYRPIAGGVQEDLNVRDVRGVETVSWGTAANLAYRLSEMHEISANFLYTQTGESEARQVSGFNLKQDQAGDVFESTVLRYTERHMNLIQFVGRHEFPDFWNWQTEWLASIATTSQEDPDLRYMAKFDRVSGFSGFANTLFPTTPTRYFRLLEENNSTIRIDNTLPIPIWSDLEAQFKTGFYQAESEREYTDRGFSYESLTDYAPWNLDGDPNTFIPTMSNSATLAEFFIRALPQNSYSGQQTITAGYWMGELPVHEKLRFIGGVRLESTDIRIKSTGGSVATTTVNSSLSQVDLLPAAGVIYSPVTNMNFRLHFSQTIGRPTYREISNIETFDFAGGDILVGNPNLKMTAVDNYDARWEWYPRPGYILAAGAFFKSLTDPIEQSYVTLDQDKIIYDNRDKATVYGFEAEARASFEFIDDLLADFSAGVNFAWIESVTDLTAGELANKRLIDPSEPETRPLYNQSPYIINFDLGYDNRRSGTSANIIFNIAGERLVITNPFGGDVYQQPAASLDFNISQKLGKSQRWKVKFSAKNLLNPAYERTYGSDPAGLIYSSSTKGRTYGISLSYSY